MRSLVLIVLLTTALQIQAQSVDSLLYQKVLHSTPGLDDNSFNNVCSNLGYWGTRFAHDINRHDVHSIAGYAHHFSIGGTNQVSYPY